MTIYVGIIDGTGPKDDQAYKQAMEQSFCHVLAKGLPPDKVQYQRGPGTTGSEEGAEAQAIAAWSKQKHDRDKDAQIILVGYSRGGSGVLWAAEQLRQAGVQVHSMFLFDAVSRQMSTHGRNIPANVQFSRAARRSDDRDFVKKYEGTVKTSDLLGNSSNPCRPFFSNTGVSWDGNGDHQKAKVFMGSHGALGGVGWKFVVEDAKYHTDVSSWMTQQMSSRGLQANLGPGWLNPQPPEKASALYKRLNGIVDDVEITGSRAHRALLGGHRGPLTPRL